MQERKSHSSAKKQTATSSGKSSSGAELSAGAIHGVARIAGGYAEGRDRLRPHGQEAVRDKATSQRSEASASFQYQVQPGDTLSEIAARFDVEGGYFELATLNHLHDPNKIRVGQWLTVPGSSGNRQAPPRPPTTDSSRGQFAGLDPVVKYIVGEMQRNAAGDRVSEIRRLLTPDLTSLVPGVYAAEVVSAFWKWFKLVKPDGTWDHKPYISKTFGEWVSDSLSRRSYNFDIWSNIHYGFVGSAAGFGIDILLNGGGIAQILAGTVPPGVLDRVVEDFASVPVLAAFDDPRDRVAIELGANLWNSVGTGVSVQIVEAVVRAQAGSLNTKPMQDQSPFYFV